MLRFLQCSGHKKKSGAPKTDKVKTSGYVKPQVMGSGSGKGLQVPCEQHRTDLHIWMKLLHVLWWKLSPCCMCHLLSPKTLNNVFNNTPFMHNIEKVTQYINTMSKQRNKKRMHLTYFQCDVIRKIPGCREKSPLGNYDEYFHKFPTFYTWHS